MGFVSLVYYKATTNISQPVVCRSFEQNCIQIIIDAISLV